MEPTTDQRVPDLEEETGAQLPMLEEEAVTTTADEGHSDKNRGGKGPFSPVKNAYQGWVTYFTHPVRYIAST